MARLLPPSEIVGICLSLLIDACNLSAPKEPRAQSCHAGTRYSQSKMEIAAQSSTPAVGAESAHPCMRMAVVAVLLSMALAV